MSFDPVLFNWRERPTKALSAKHVGANRFLDARTEGGAPLNTAYIKAEMLLILLAGADTTGTALQGFLYFILTHPSVYETLMAEIDAATRAGYLSPAMPQYHEVQRHCPYYIACMRETLRLRTPAYGTMPRVVSKGGMRFDGGLVAPEGTEVTAHSGPTHFNKEIFGDDAAEFRPDRWLVDEKVVAEYLRFSLSFGYGARVCLGKDLAMMELCKGGLQVSEIFSSRGFACMQRPSCGLLFGSVMTASDSFFGPSASSPSRTNQRPHLLAKAGSHTGKIYGLRSRGAVPLPAPERPDHANHFLV